MSPALFLVFLFASTLPASLTRLPCPAGKLYLSTTNECVQNCPSGYFVTLDADDSLLCAAQTIVTTHLRLTPQTGLFILYFECPISPFTSSQQMMSSMSLLLSSFDDESHTQIAQNASIQFLDSEHKIAQIFVSLDNVPVASKLLISFPSYSADNPSRSFVISSDQLPSVGFTAQSRLVNALTDFDFVLEIAWTTLTLFNPYAFLFMNAKFYRETFNMLKYLNIDYENFLVKFFKQNNNKISGFKIPNLLSHGVYNNPLTSGWNRAEEVMPKYHLLPENRLNDLKLSAFGNYYEFEPFTLFIDTYGVQLAMLGICLVIVLVMEALQYIFKPSRTDTQLSNRPSKFQAIRVTFRWNLCIAIALGSYQSLCFYSLVQFRTFFASEKTAHNVYGFLFALFSFFGLGIVFPVLLVRRLKQITKMKKERVLANEHYHYENLTNYYGIFCQFFNIDRLHYPVYIPVLLSRSFIFAILTVFAEDNSNVQISFMIGSSIAFIVYFLVVWPYKSFIYNLLQCIYEALLFAMLSVLLLLSTTEPNKTSNLRREIVCYIILVIWVSVPVVSTVSGAAGIISMLFEARSKTKSSVRVVQIAPEPVEKIQIKEKDNPSTLTTARSYIASTSTTTPAARSVHQLPQCEHRINIPSIEEVMSENAEENEERESEPEEVEEKSVEIKGNPKPNLIKIGELETRRYFF